MNKNPNSPSNRRGQISFASGLNLALGVWLILTPFLFGYQAPVVLWNNVIVGALVVLLAWARIANRAGASTPAWFNALLGLWMVVSPLMFAYGNAAVVWSNVIAGAGILVLGAWSGSVRGPTRGHPAGT